MDQVQQTTLSLFSRSLGTDCNNLVHHGCIFMFILFFFYPHGKCLPCWQFNLGLCLFIFFIQVLRSRLEKDSLLWGDDKSRSTVDIWALMMRFAEQGMLTCKKRERFLPGDCVVALTSFGGYICWLAYSYKKASDESGAGPVQWSQHRWDCLTFYEVKWLRSTMPYYWAIHSKTELTLSSYLRLTLGY